MFRRAILIEPTYADPYLTWGWPTLAKRRARGAGRLSELRAVNPEAAARLAVFLGPPRGSEVSRISDHPEDRLTDPLSVLALKVQAREM